MAPRAIAGDVLVGGPTAAREVDDLENGAGSADAERLRPLDSRARIDTRTDGPVQVL
jgi:hypothetical protein